MYTAPHTIAIWGSSKTAWGEDQAVLVTLNARITISQEERYKMSTYVPCHGTTHKERGWPQSASESSFAHALKLSLAIPTNLAPLLNERGTSQISHATYKQFLRSTQVGFAASPDLPRPPNAWHLCCILSCSDLCEGQPGRLDGTREPNGCGFGSKRRKTRILGLPMTVAYRLLHELIYI